MKLVPLLVLALAACKSHKPAAKAAGSAAPVAATAPAKSAATSAPERPTYTAPEAPEDEVVPVQAQAAMGSGSAVAPHVVPHDPIARQVQALDANHDGKLTPDEVRKTYGDDVDANGDGEISRSELQDAMRARRVRARASQKR